MKKKYINGLHWNWVEKSSAILMHIAEPLTGYISLINIEKVKYKVIVGNDENKICLYDDGYKCIIFLPDNENWCVSAIYNINNKIVEWYFDMTKVNSIDENGIPFFYDLYLDIAVSPDFTVTILDEDELQEAVKDKIITTSDYELAHNTCKKIIDNYIPDKSFLVDFFQKHLDILLNE